MPSNQGEDAPHVVTGAFGYSGKYIARRLLNAGLAVRTLTDSNRRRNPFGGAIDIYPFHFNRPDLLIDALRGAEVLYNTYWVRFNHKEFDHRQAVENTLRLFAAAREAGVRRVVHVSIANPSEDSPLEYYRGKAILERALAESGMSHAILRPTVLFGKEDILINNIAWCLRRFPIFGVFGDGQYPIQPVFVDDLARLAVEQGRKTENVVLNVVGPETFSYRELVDTIGRLIGSPRRIIRLSPTLGYLAGRALGAWMRDVMITREEIRGLMAGLLAVDSPPTGHARLSTWVRDNADSLGRRYRSELARRRHREVDYERL